MKDFSMWPITESSQLGEVRRFVNLLARDIGFNEVDTGKAAIVVTEAATNLLKHGKGGELLLRPISPDEGYGVGLEVMALDKGPGIASIEQALRDGYSTAGSPGTGLGAISRLMTHLDIYSHPKLGTALLADLYIDSDQAEAGATTPFEMGAVCLPKRGEVRSGDAWGAHAVPDGLQVMVVDGLGHGDLAAETAQQAIEVFNQRPQLMPGALVEACHLAMPKTRGAALAVARINTQKQLVTFAGIGNIVAAIWNANGQRNMVSHNGIVGHQIARIQEFTYPWTTEALLLMHSDGLSTQFKLDVYPGLSMRQPSLIAGVLYRDFKRERDDMTMVVVRERRAASLS